MIEACTRLPHLSDWVFATDSGLETTLIFNEGYELPFFEAFVLLKTASGRERLRDYYMQHTQIAVDAGLGSILGCPTWRANPDWAQKLGISKDELAELNRASLALMRDIRSSFVSQDCPMVISGVIGPRNDGYDPGQLMSVGDARAYHAFQTDIFAKAGADMVEALTMNNIPEATGVALAARDAGIPAVISFTVETDGRLPTGEKLSDAILAVDAATGSSPIYYMINCAHPDHFMPVLEEGGAWLQRLKGLRANASRCSHEELDNSSVLDDGDPVELGELYGEIRRRHPQINVVGGCCGTDHRHISQISHAFT